MRPLTVIVGLNGESPKPRDIQFVLTHPIARELLYARMLKQNNSDVKSGAVKR